MTFLEMQMALAQLGTDLPHGFVPGAVIGGTTNPAETEKSWDSYDWGTVNGAIPGIDAADPDADPKPSWADLTAALVTANLGAARSADLAGIKTEASRRITAGYDAEDWTDEIQTRLRDGQTAEQDTERDRLRGKYQELKTWVEDSSRTLAELQSFDPTDDTNWEGT